MDLPFSVDYLGERIPFFFLVF